MDATFDTDPTVLSLLAEHDEWRVRRALAQNEATPEATVRLLATDWDARVRRALAFREDVPVTVLDQLSIDRSETVRAAVAWNPRTPLRTLLTLAGDPAEEVRVSVAGHPKTPFDLAVELFDSSSSLAEEVADRIISRIEDPDVRRIVERTRFLSIRQAIDAAQRIAQLAVPAVPQPKRGL